MYKIPAYEKILTMRNFLKASNIALQVSGYNMFLGDVTDQFDTNNCGIHDFCAYTEMGAWVQSEYDTELYHVAVEEPIKLFTVQELIIGVGLPAGFNYKLTGTPSEDWVNLGTKKGVTGIHWKYSVQGVSLRMLKSDRWTEIRICVAKKNCVEVGIGVISKVQTHVDEAYLTRMDDVKVQFNSRNALVARGHRRVRELELLKLRDKAAAEMLEKQRLSAMKDRVARAEKEIQRREQDKGLYATYAEQERERERLKQSVIAEQKRKELASAKERARADAAQARLSAETELLIQTCREQGFYDKDAYDFHKAKMFLMEKAYRDKLLEEAIEREKITQREEERQEQSREYWEKRNREAYHRHVWVQAWHREQNKSMGYHSDGEDN